MNKDLIKDEIKSQLKKNFGEEMNSWGVREWGKWVYKLIDNWNKRTRKAKYIKGCINYLENRS